MGSRTASRAPAKVLTGPPVSAVDPGNVSEDMALSQGLPCQHPMDFCLLTCSFTPR